MAGEVVCGRCVHLDDGECCDCPDCLRYRHWRPYVLECEWLAVALPALGIGLVDEVREVRG